MITLTFFLLRAGFKKVARIRFLYIESGLVLLEHIVLGQGVPEYGFIPVISIHGPVLAMQVRLAEFGLAEGGNVIKTRK